MNANAKKWADAALSGLYKQGVYRLRQSDRFCIMGLACELYAQELSEEERGEFVKIRANDIYSYGGSTAYLPCVVANWLGISSLNGYLIKDGKPITLSYLNDREGLNFQELGRLIASNPPGLFK